MLTYFPLSALPIYTAAKQCAIPLSPPTTTSLTLPHSGVVGFVRSFGKYLPEEGMTLNAVSPNVVRTNISTGAFYERMESKGLLTPMKVVIDAFEQFLDGDVSGECMEGGPNGDLVRRAPAEYLDRETGEVMELLYERGHALHEPVA